MQNTILSRCIFGNTLRTFTKSASFTYQDKRLLSSSFHASDSHHGDTTSRSIYSATGSSRVVAATWDVLNPAEIDPHTLLEGLPVLEHSDWKTLRTAILLVTPSLAHLLDNQGWLKSALTKIYGESIVSDQAQHPQSITSVTGVIDKLWIPCRSTAAEAYGYQVKFAEGITLLLRTGLKLEKFTYIDQSSQESTPTLKLSSGPIKVATRKSLVNYATVPLANTTFINGQRSTFNKDDWNLSSSAGRGELVHKNQSRLQSVDVALNFWSLPFLDGYLAMRPLTVERPIVDSMGNVVRTIKAANGTEIPASQELEKAVNDMRKTQDLSNVQLTVFAKITPPEMSSIKNRLRLDPSNPRIKARKRSRSILQDLIEGAKLYKVTGGGGGWGKKQGLLSLDTAVDFGPVSERSSWPVFGDAEMGEDEPARIGGTAIPAGSTIQFFSNFEPIVWPATPVAKRSIFPRDFTMADWTRFRSFRVRLGLVPKSFYEQPVKALEKDAVVDRGGAEGSFTSDLTYPTGKEGTATTEVSENSDVPVTSRPTTPDGDVSEVPESRFVRSYHQNLPIQLYRDLFSIVSETGLAVGVDEIHWNDPNPSKAGGPHSSSVGTEGQTVSESEVRQFTRTRIDVTSSSIHIDVPRKSPNASNIEPKTFNVNPKFPNYTKASRAFRNSTGEKYIPSNVSGDKSQQQMEEDKALPIRKVIVPGYFIAR